MSSSSCLGGLGGGARGRKGEMLEQGVATSGEGGELVFLHVWLLRGHS